ncbi:MAG: hypothetical protein M1368_10330 [Thaumarchaeota archaeon]|nr:hypothetical protein [Nitrososphaerota archaeon]
MVRRLSADYPWVTDFLNPIFAPSGHWTQDARWNITEMGVLYQEAVNASINGNYAQIVSASDQMNELGNQMVMYVWLFHPVTFTVITSNVQGYYENPSTNGFYFAALR